MLGRSKQKDGANYIYNRVHHPETYSESSQTSKKTFFLQKKDFLTIFVKSFIFDIWLGFECVSAIVGLEMLWIETAI